MHGDLDPRQGSPYVRGWLRIGHALGRAAGRVGVRPTAVTAVGVLLSVCAPIAAGQGGLRAVGAAGLVLLSAVADTVDGAVAVVCRRASRLGYVYDSVADRVSEAAWLVALWRIGTPGWLAALCGGLAWLHEYARARAVAAGMDDLGVVSIAERPTRVILAIVGLALGGLTGLIDPSLGRGTATAAVAIWTVFGLIAAGQLGNAIRAALRRAPQSPPPPPPSS